MVEKYQISDQIDFIKDLTKRLPNHESVIGRYGYVDYPKSCVISDIKRIRRELLKLQKMIKEAY